MSTPTGIRTLVERTRADGWDGRDDGASGAVTARPGGAPAPRRPCPRRPRPVGRRDAVRPAVGMPGPAGPRGAVGCTGGRRQPARARVRPVSSPSAVVLRRRRVLAGSVLVVLLAALVVAGGLLLSSGGPGAAGSGPVPSGVSVEVVRPGETLTGLAVRVAPGAGREETVARIRDLNGMTGSVVEPGRPLRVPAG